LRYTDSVGTREQFSIAAQWLACTYPYRRFTCILTNARARLGADVVRYSFIAVDLHHLLLAGLPAHLCENDDYHDDFQGLRKSDHVERLARDERRLGNGFATPDFSPASQFFEFSHCLGTLFAFTSDRSLAI
jgi:hypothetical protein